MATAPKATLGRSRLRASFERSPWPFYALDFNRLEQHHGRRGQIETSVGDIGAITRVACLARSAKLSRKGGSVMIDMLRRSLPRRIIARLSRHPIIVVTTVDMGIKLGRDGLAYRKGKIAVTELRSRVGGHFGNLGGGMAGAAAGAAAGSVLLPGIGMLLGGFAGGMVGSELGGRAGRAAVQQAEKRLDDLRGVRSDAPPKRTL